MSRTITKERFEQFLLDTINAELHDLRTRYKNLRQHGYNHDRAMNQLFNDSSEEKPTQVPNDSRSKEETQ